MSTHEPIRPVETEPRHRPGKRALIGLAAVVGGLFVIAACQSQPPHKKKGPGKPFAAELRLPDMPRLPHFHLGL